MGVNIHRITDVAVSGKRRHCDERRHCVWQALPGFTLVELLVVIAIMAVLLSILVPALGQAKWQAKRLVCMTNIRAQWRAQTMYADDNEGRFPRHSGTWPDYLGWNIGSDHPDSMIWTVMYGTSYVPDSGVFVCPITACFGGWFADPSVGEGVYGGWDSASTVYKHVPYIWAANFRPGGQKMIPRVGEPDWPGKLSECNERTAMIFHHITGASDGSVAWDWSHQKTGTSAYFTPTEPGSWPDAETTDNPTGYGDGHVEYRTKGLVEVRVVSGLTGTVWYY